jgi:fatty-acyl-CoA synthase
MLELIESERANGGLFVPTMILALLEHPDFSKRDLSSYRVMLSGASVVPAALVNRTKAAFGADLVILFGQTELNGVVCVTTPTDSVEDQSETLGRPLPQVDLRIVDPETGATQPIDTPGEIWIRGYQAMLGYCGMEEATRATIGADGWVRMGDLAAMDARGYLRITGRLKDMIIRGGMNIYAREIEDVLFDHPSVAEVAIIGIPDERWGEVVAAVIRPADPETPLSPDALHAHCRARLAAHKAPSVWFSVVAYPLTPSGKIQKFVLQDWVKAGSLTPLIWSRSSETDKARMGGL